MNQGKHLLIKEAVIVDPEFPERDRPLDILIEDGVIRSIGKDISAGEEVELIEGEDLHLSAGWFDVGVQVCDPGYEHREDLYSADRAAAAGGYTDIATQPNTRPVAHSKSEILYFRRKSGDLLIDCHPIGAVSKDCAGVDITEMIDMQRAGAIAFSDGSNSIQNSGLMLRALQYVQSFDGLLINYPLDRQMSPEGQMHEGSISTILGMRGIPDLAEELMVERDIRLTEYTGSRLHLSNISTAGSVRRIREAKAQGIRVTASVAALNLLYDHHKLENFDSNYKLLPPLRSPEDRESLKAGLLDGTIDFVSSNHVPWDEESKKVEFPYAAFGAIGLETTFSVVRTAFGQTVDVGDLIRWLAIRPREVLSLPRLEIKEGHAARLTVFSPDEPVVYGEKEMHSKSRNTPLLGAALTGRVHACINGRRYFVSDRR